MVGSILLAVSAYILSQLEVDSATYIVEIALVCQGFGFGLSMMPNSVSGLNALPNRFVAQATPVRQLNVRVIASFVVAALATVLAIRLGDMSATSPEVAGSVVAQDAYNTVFTVMAGLAVLAAVQGLFLPGKERNRQLQSDRAAEYGAAVDAM